MVSPHLLIAALIAMIVPSLAEAQWCPNRADMLMRHVVPYKETLQGWGLSGNGVLVTELFVSPAGTWSIIAHQAKGSRCATALAGGTYWEPAPAHTEETTHGQERHPK